MDDSASYVEFFPTVEYAVGDYQFYAMISFEGSELYETFVGMIQSTEA